MEPNDQPDIGINTDIRCGCGGACFTSVGERKTVFTCLDCGQWVATMTIDIADGAGVIEVDA